MYVYKDWNNRFQNVSSFYTVPRKCTGSGMILHIFWHFWQKIWPGCQYPGQIKTCFRVKNNPNNTKITLKITKNVIASSQSEVSIRECERAPVPVYRQTKQLNISKTKRFWHMVYRTKNVGFHPLNPFPPWPDPTRPDPTRPWRSLTAYISETIQCRKKYYQA